MKDKVQKNPLESVGRSLSSGDKEVVDASCKIENVQLLHLLLFSKIHVDEVLRAFRIVDILVTFDLFNQV